MPGVLAHEHRDLGALEVGRRVTARPPEQLPVDPGLAGLLLRERVRHVPDAERRPGGRRVRAAEVVALAAAAVVEDRLAAVLVPDRAQALGDLADRGVPVDLLEGAVGPAAQRRGQPVARVLVVVEALRLLAGVAVRARAGLVTADPTQMAVLDLDLDAAVEAAEDARGLQPARSVVLHREGHGRGPYTMMIVIARAERDLGDTTADSKRQMVESAALLFREQGYSGTGFNAVIEHSGAPRGSIYHHFPGGKAELAAETVRYAGGGGDADRAGRARRRPRGGAARLRRVLAAHARAERVPRRLPGGGSRGRGA